MELYRKIYIKSEADLPVKEQPYLGQDEKSIHWIGYYPSTSDLFEYQKDHWLNLVDWYLQHEQITDSDIEAWAEEYCSKCSSSFDETLKYGIKLGAKAALNGEIKHIEK
jgi:hypothetical protein